MGVVRFLIHLSLRVVLSSFAFSSVSALAASSYLDPSRIIFQRPDSATQLELIDCFRNGNCEQDDKIRIYPMPCIGSGTEDCTGCYAMRAGSPVRIGDLDLTTGSCAGVGSSSEEKIRVFVGYERKCPSTTPVGGSCTGDGHLLLSCSMSSDGEFTYNKDCFSGTPYVRRANTAAPTLTVIPSSAPIGQAGCDAGTMGIYPSCVSCSDTSYKPTIGNGACTNCVVPTIANAASVNVSTAGTTKTSVNDCRVNFTCNSPYTPNLANQTCMLATTPDPNPTPSTGLSSDPSPSPTPSRAPTCADANMSLSVVSIKPAGTYDNAGLITLRLTWSPIFTGMDYVVVYGYRFILGEKKFVDAPSGTNFGRLYGQSIKTIYFGQGPGPAGTSGKLQAADYYLTPIYTLNGMHCPQAPPMMVTVPML